MIAPDTIYQESIHTAKDNGQVVRLQLKLSGPAKRKFQNLENLGLRAQLCRSKRSCGYKKSAITSGFSVAKIDS